MPFGLTSAPRVFTKVMRPVVTFLRAQGIRLVIYLDDLLVLAQSRERLIQYRSLILDLFENLGFLINYPKSVLTPTQEIIFLGFWVSTVTLHLLLLKEKVTQAVREAQNLIREGTTSARQLSRLIGRFTSTLPAILPGPLHYRGLQQLKHSALRLGGYDETLPLTTEARNDLEWWSQDLAQVNGRGLIRESPSMTISSDASLSGWGAVYLQQRIGGPWTEVEKRLHIYCLELLGATFAIQAFAKDRRDIVIQILLDNATAVAYINHMGGTRSHHLWNLAKTLWDWCLQRRILLVASHIPGVVNVEADFMSRTVVDRHDWQLSKTVFHQLNALWGPLEVDLFASRVTKQLARFFSWKPDPLAEATDAFKQSWRGFLGFANPPWGLVGRCLQHVLQEETTIVLITPLWPAQPWFPALFPLLLDFPRLLPEAPDLITNFSEDRIPLPEGASTLAAWYISGSHTRTQDFQTRQLHSSWPPGGVPQPRITTPAGGSGRIGVTTHTPIQFLPL